MKAEYFSSKKVLNEHFTKLHEALMDYLGSLGITPTEQYIAVLEFVLKNNTHPTVDDIFNALNKSIPDLSRTRIYSILDILDRIGAVNVIYFDKYTVHYDGNVLPHAHLLCDKCGQVIDIELCDEMRKRSSSTNGMLIRKVQMLCEGLCPKCVDESDVN